MAKNLLSLVFLCWLFSCRQKPLTLADNEKVDVQDFIAFFQPLHLPFFFADTLLLREEPDSLRIGPKIFRQFVPDSVLGRQFGKNHSLRLYPAGKAGTKNEETFLFIKALAPAKKVLYLACFDKSGVFLAAKALIIADQSPRGNVVASMDSKFTLTILHQHKKDEQLLYRKDAFVFTREGLFTLILTESNEAKPKTNQLFNPLDTLPRKHKFSGDYLQDKHSFVSVRDHKDPARMHFFVHFEKEPDDCRGELKGEARYVSANVAQYRRAGDPCVLQFSFGPNDLRLKELEGCGNHRDIKCYFDGQYEKRLPPKARTRGKK